MHDHQQITFITLSRLCPLSTPPPLLFLMDNIKLAGILTKFKWNKYICLFHIVFQILKVLFIKCYKIQLPDWLYLVLNQLLHQHIYIYIYNIYIYISIYNIYIYLFNIIWKKILTNFYVFSWIRLNSLTPIVKWPRSTKCDQGLI